MTGRAAVPGASLLAIHAAPLFLGAVLLFSVQPLFTKMALPLLGGAPAVWNTAVVFFQAALLAGYLYAHVGSRVMPLKAQVTVHMALLVLAFAVLPIGVAADWSPPVDAWPVPWLIALLAVSLGLPFFAVAATAPLLQRWFSHGAHPTASDPYHLYAVSNLGSLLALLGYPFVIEMTLGLGDQSRLWTWGYGLLVVLIGVCGAIAWRDNQAGSEPEPESPAAPPLAWRERLHWMVLAFVPASLLLGVTLHIGTDVAAAPLLWVVPLALYLLSFVLTFAREPIPPHRWMVHAQALALIALAIGFDTRRLWIAFALHLLGLFVTAMVCHGELVRRRPAVGHLTEFYLWLSIGGLLGGVFSAIVAPLVFDSALEYPLVLVLACLLRPGPRPRGLKGWTWTAAIPAAIALIYLYDEEIEGLFPPSVGDWLVVIVTGSLLFAMRRRPVGFALGIAAVLFVGQILTPPGTVLTRERSFFGIHTVFAHGAGNVHELMNGSIRHGIQVLDGDFERTPLAYFHRDGPLGQLFAALDGRGDVKRIAVVGLGIGTIACYGKPGQTMTFYEIDPTVARLALDERYFRYLTRCGVPTRVVLGDGRLGLSKAADGQFDLIILDAYSSDAPPVHLLTREALALYLAKLSDGGLLVFQLSNVYMDLEPVVGRLIADAGVAGRIFRDDREELWRLKSASTWAVVGRRRDDLALLDGDPRWRPLRHDPATPVWTDDHSSIVGVLNWGRFPW